MDFTPLSAKVINRHRPRWLCHWLALWLTLISTAASATDINALIDHIDKLWRGETSHSICHHRGFGF